MTARPSGRRRYAAVTGSPRGPHTVTGTSVPPQASRKQATVPSPPSATGMRTAAQPGNSSARH